MDYAETAAKIFMEAAVPGGEMKFHSKQSNMEYDFDLRYPSGDVAAVEVTSSRSQNATQTNAKIFNERTGGEFIPAVRCRNSWYIFPSPDSRIDKIRKNADCYLAQLEAEGIDNFRLDRTQGSPPCVQRICSDLNLIEGVSKEGRAEIRIASVIESGPADSTTAIEAGEKEIEANREKLGKAKTEERHLVVYIDHNHSLPHSALVFFGPPSELPRLPNEITHIWLISEHRSAGRFVFWHASKKATWKKDILQTRTSQR